MKDPLLGLDAGASNIKIIELKEKKGRFALKNIAIAPMPANVIVDGMVLDHGGASTAVKNCLSGIKKYNKDCAIGLRGRDVVVKRISVPWSGQGNFLETFLWGAEQYVGIKADRASFDAQLINYDKEKNIADTVVAAAYRDKVADCIAMTKMAGLKPIVADIEALALVNLITAMKNKQTHVNALLDIGHDCTNIIFYENGYVDMIKSLPKGIKYLMEELAQDMDCDMDKVALSIRDRQFMGNDVDAQAASMSFGSSLGAEIETAIEIYMSERRKEPVDFYACGAGAYIPDVLEQVEIAMKVSIKRLNPFEFIDISEQHKPIIEQAGACTFAVASGLAMRRA